MRVKVRRRAARSELRSRFPIERRTIASEEILRLLVSTQVVLLYSSVGKSSR